MDNVTHNERSAASMRYQDDDQEAFDEADDFPVDPGRVDVDSIIALTARLSHVLAAEVDCLGAMKIQGVGALQREKLALLEALETQKRFIDRNRDLLKRVSDEEMLELAQIIEIFQNVLRENHHRLLVAREVNRTVIDAIADVVRESGRGGIYDETGKPECLGRIFPMNLNQTI